MSVQNGGGVKGRGAAMATKLQGLGFSPGKATNAKAATYAATTIFYKAGHEADAVAIQKALGLGTVKPAAADVAFATNVVVVVGKDF